MFRLTIFFTENDLCNVDETNKLQEDKYTSVLLVPYFHILRIRPYLEFKFIEMVISMLHCLYMAHVPMIPQLSTNSILSFSESEIKRYQFEPETDSESIDSSTFDHEQGKIIRVSIFTTT